MKSFSFFIEQAANSAQLAQQRMAAQRERQQQQIELSAQQREKQKARADQQAAKREAQKENQAERIRKREEEQLRNKVDNLENQRNQ
jgi:hypothetical protein